MDAFCGAEMDGENSKAPRQEWDFPSGGLRILLFFLLVVCLRMALAGSLLPVCALFRLPPQRIPQVFARPRPVVCRYLLRCAGRDHGAAAVSALWTHVDEVVRGFDEVEVVFDHHDGVALLHEPLENADELFHIRGVQSRRRLIENVDRAPGLPFRQLRRQLDALCLAAG